jgi:hypothetical protein
VLRGDYGEDPGAVKDSLRLLVYSPQFRRGEDRGEIGNEKMENREEDPRCNTGPWATRL